MCFLIVIYNRNFIILKWKRKTPENGKQDGKGGKGENEGTTVFKSAVAPINWLVFLF